MKNKDTITVYVKGVVIDCQLRSITLVSIDLGTKFLYDIPVEYCGEIASDGMYWGYARHHTPNIGDCILVEACLIEDYGDDHMVVEIPSSGFRRVVVPKGCIFET